MEQHRSSGQRLSAHPNDFSHDAWHLPSQVNKTFTGPIILPTGHLPTDAGRPRHESGAAGASKRIAPRPNPVQSASIPVAAPPIQRDASATHARHSAQPVRLAPNGTGSSSPKGAVRRNSSGANPAHTGRKLPAAVKSQTDAQLPVRCRSQSPKELQYARRLPPQAAKARPSPIEQVIQVGNRCGNQDYWRSSLQMPKRTGVKKATGKVRSRLTESQNSRATEKTQQPSRDIHAQGDGGGATRKGMPPKEKESEVGGRRYESGLVDPSLTRTPLDVGQHHEFWRKSTKLPSVSSNKARQRRLADGKRRALDVMEGRGPLAEKSDILGQATGRARKSNVVPSDEVTISSPGKNRRVNEAVESFGKEDSANGDTPLALDNRSGERQRTPQEFLDEELKDNRKIIRTKDYEVRQMEAYAESRLHVKMNLRGRNKIWNWLSGGDRLTSYSVMFLVFTMDLDRKLISSSSTERKQALEEMENDSLRMLEALMMRLGTKDGCDNWHALTENFNLEE
ncbi:unnamed protein product [Chondrus crispus]|uniref:Uncharacterized protein n=1 Tax=Chondrus crispus TaxID=2769 RepID=R7QGG5_CHOCR|nr:unnamed protein product [Chondrus crispus]CDF37184.1 unnamed protein product [Chondrus crispus]|eukprot:XP_005717003.1 unnamed protein product [Chondrus crispus]